MSDMIVTATPVYRGSYDYGIYNNDHGFPDAAQRFLIARATGAEDGTLTATLLDQCLNPRIKGNTQSIETILRNGAYVEELRAKNPHLSYWSEYQGNKVFNASQQTELTNGAMAPIAALYHYILGDGSAMSADLGKLSFNFNRDNLVPVNTILNSGQIGSFQIDSPIGYDFRQSSWWEWSYLGRVSLRLNGTLKVDSAGQWSFQGTVTGTKDIYDANPDASRGIIGELLTDVLRSLNGQVFDINFKGEHQIYISDRK